MDMPTTAGRRNVRCTSTHSSSSGTSPGAVVLSSAPKKDMSHEAAMVRGKQRVPCTPGAPRARTAGIDEEIMKRQRKIQHRRRRNTQQTPGSDPPRPGAWCRGASRKNVSTEHRAHPTGSARLSAAACRPRPPASTFCPPPAAVSWQQPSARSPPAPRAGMGGRAAAAAGHSPDARHGAAGGRPRALARHKHPPANWQVEVVTRRFSFFLFCFSTVTPPPSNLPKIPKACRCV